MKQNTRDYGKFHPRFARGGVVQDQLGEAYGCKGTEDDPYICSHPNAERPYEPSQRFAGGGGEAAGALAAGKAPV
jgi:hypothetical protein